MNNALQYHIKTSLKNMGKRTLKRPLKSIGVILLTLYFCYLPFLMKPVLEENGLNTPSGFVLLSTAITLYISAPSALSYFKRNGIMFRKEDVNLLLATPISPKQILFYALFKQAYIQIVWQVATVIVGGYFIFRIPLPTILLFGIVDLFFSSLLQYSLAIIMYGSETISNKTKNIIKWIVYAVLLLITIVLIVYFIFNGFSINSTIALARHPLVLFIPIFGWQIGWLNFMILGANPITTLTSILFIITAIALAYSAYRMKCTGEYYEDALKFSQRTAKLEAKKGQVDFHDIFNKKRKVNKVNTKLSGTRANVIFSRQKLERRRTNKFFLSFGDFIFLAIGIGAGFFMRFGLGSDSKLTLVEIQNTYYFIVASGLTIYFALFFSPKPTWKDEFSSYFLFIIPDRMINKLWSATLTEHCISLLRAILLAVPFGLIVGASPIDILLVVCMQVLLKTMLTYQSILISGYIGSKVGNTFAFFLDFTVKAIVFIVPIISLTISASISQMFGVGLFIGYCIGMTLLFMWLCTKVLTNIESLK